MGLTPEITEAEPLLANGTNIYCTLFADEANGYVPCPGHMSDLLPSETRAHGPQICRSAL